MKAIRALCNEQGGDPFAWGSRDCLTLCADVAKTLTGTDPMQALRGRYKSAHGAKRVMKTEGWRDMADVAASMYAEIPVSLARTGDWAWIEDGDTLGVVAKHMIVSRTESRGLGQVPLTRAKRAFRVA